MIKKYSFVASLILAEVIPTLALGQNYYAPEYFQNNSQRYANYGYTQNYSYPQNYGYYTQQAPQYPQPQLMQANNKNTVNAQKAKDKRGVGTVSIGADYVLGYFKFNSKEYNLGKVINSGSDYIFDTNEFEQENNSVSFNLGWRPFKFIGIEAYYLSSLKSTKKGNFLSNTYYPEFEIAEQEVSYQSYGVDILGYYTINDYIEFIASIGVGKYEVEGDVTISAKDIGVSPNIIRQKSKSFEEAVTAYRIGGGVQLWLSRHVSMRLMGRWTKLGGDIADYITEVNVGIRYHF